MFILDGPKLITLNIWTCITIWISCFLSLNYNICWNGLVSVTHSFVLYSKDMQGFCSFYKLLPESYNMIIRNSHQTFCFLYHFPGITMALQCLTQVLLQTMFIRILMAPSFYERQMCLTCVSSLTLWSLSILLVISQQRYLFPN